MTIHAAQPVSAADAEKIAVYWRPGCSGCLALKEFMEDSGIPFESIDITADPSKTDGIMAELAGAGIRTIPAIRRGGKYIYAQSIEDVAKLLGVRCDHERLSNEELYKRWEQILPVAYRIVEKFPEHMFAERAIPVRGRTLRELAVHLFQIPYGWIEQMDNGLLEIKPLLAYCDPKIVTKSDILAHNRKSQEDLRKWLASGRAAELPARTPTYYGEQPLGQVLERAVWHCTQHARQLDVVAVGRAGAEFEIPAELYEGLPLPKRIWS
jgi:glutaredoxin/uncharacterized damage-inducible protein DinB